MKADNQTVQLGYAGAIEDYYRTYYKNDMSDEVYVLTNFNGLRAWNTAVSVYGEPDMPLQNGTIIEIYEDGQLISREKVIRISDCISISIGRC